MKILASLLLVAALVHADDTAKLVDQLFHPDAAQRAAARKQLLGLKEADLAKILDRIEERQRKSERVLQVYAVRDLTTDKVFWPVTRERLRALDAVVREQEGGVLVVQATRAVHAEIAKALGEVRKRLSRVVTVWAAIVQLPQGVKAPRNFPKGGFKRWIEKHDAVIQWLPKLTCRNGKRVEVTAMKSISYIADFDVEIACGTFIADPVVETLPKGISLHVRAIAAKQVDLHIDLRASQVEQPLKVTKLELPAGQPVRIQVPESRSLHIRTSRQVEAGGTTVVDLGGDRLVVITAIPTQLAD